MSVGFAAQPNAVLDANRRIEEVAQRANRALHNENPTGYYIEIVQWIFPAATNCANSLFFLM